MVKNVNKLKNVRHPFIFGLDFFDIIFNTLIFSAKAERTISAGTHQKSSCQFVATRIRHVT